MAAVKGLDDDDDQIMNTALPRGYMCVGICIARDPPTSDLITDNERYSEKY